MVKHSKKNSDPLSTQNLQRNYENVSYLYNTSTVFSVANQLTGTGVPKAARISMIVVVFLITIALETFISLVYFQQLGSNPEEVSSGDIRRYILTIISVVNIIGLLGLLIYKIKLGSIASGMAIIVLSYHLVRFWYLVNVVDDPERVRSSLVNSLFLIGSIANVSYLSLVLINYLAHEADLTNSSLFKIPK